MAGGRPPAWLIGTSAKGVLGHDAKQVDPKGRLSLPSRIAEAVSWIGAREDAVDVLGVLDQPGLVRLVSWDAYADKLIESHSRLVHEAERDEDGWVEQRRFEDRYRKLRIEPSDTHRMNLPPPVVAHLELDANRTVHVIRIRDVVELWGQAYRNAQLPGAYPGLP